MMDQWAGFLGNAYPWVKAAHLIFAVFWIAGMFMLPRNIIYQVATVPGSADDLMWTDRIGKLRRIILTPAMTIVWVLGLMLAVNIGAFHMGWFHAKFLTVFLLSGYHGWAVGMAKKVAAGHRPASDKSLRLMNEIPGVATAIIVILVIVKPF